MTKPTYWELLRDPRWQEKRLRIMDAAGFACEECGDKTTTLNVHHRYYAKGRKPWEYEDASLACLCEPCHKRATDMIGEATRIIGLLSSGGLEEALGFLRAHAWFSGVSDSENTVTATTAEMVYGVCAAFAITGVLVRESIADMARHADGVLNCEALISISRAQTKAERVE